MGAPAGFYTGLATGISEGGVDTGTGLPSTPWQQGAQGGISTEEVNALNANITANDNAAQAAGFPSYESYGTGGGSLVQPFAPSNLVPASSFSSGGASAPVEMHYGDSASSAQAVPATSATPSMVASLVPSIPSPTLPGQLLNVQNVGGQTELVPTLAYATGQGPSPVAQSYTPPSGIFDVIKSALLAIF